MVDELIIHKLAMFAAMTWLRWYDFYGDSEDEDMDNDESQPEETPPPSRLIVKKRRYKTRTMKCVREDRVVTRSVTKTFKYR